MLANCFFQSIFIHLQMNESVKKIQIINIAQQTLKSEIKKEIKGKENKSHNFT